MFITGYVHPPSILDGRYNGPHLRKAEITDLIKNKKKIVGKPVFFDHKEEAIGKIVDVEKTTIGTSLGDAETLKVSLIINDNTKRGMETMDGVRSGKLNQLSFGTGINNFETHEKGYIDKIYPNEVSIVDSGYRKDCNITGFTVDDDVFLKSQINSFHVYMDSTQAGEAASRLQNDDQEVTKRAKIMNDISEALSTSEAAEFLTLIKTEKEKEAKFINEQVDSLSKASKISADTWKTTTPEILSFVCSANAQNAELEKKQKELMEKLQQFQKKEDESKQKDANVSTKLNNLLPPSTMANVVSGMFNSKSARTTVAFNSLDLPSKKESVLTDPLLIS